MPMNNNGKFAGFEDVFQKTKNVAESINKKSAQTIEISRKKVEKLDTKAKLSKAYEKYGKLQFEQSIGETVDAEELNSLTADIKAYRARIEAISAELENAIPVKNADEIKREAEELRQEMKKATDNLVSQAKEVFSAVQNSVKNEEQKPDNISENEIEVEFTESESAENSEE